MIETLPESVAARLRSSVNITSISSALKELLLNSLDAGASYIDCVVDPQSGYLQVSDDGKGIPHESLSMIGTRYGKSPRLWYVEEHNGRILSPWHVSPF
jgi:DNA mismatch repair protein MLH3